MHKTTTLRKSLSFLLVLCLILAVAPAFGPTATASALSVADYSNQNLTNNDLADLVTNGDIPLTTTVLNLAGNQLSDISPLQNLSDLLEIYLDDNAITSLDALGNNSQLEVLSASQNLINDISVMRDLYQLQTIILDDNQISDLDPMRSIWSAKTIHLNNNQISNISPLFTQYFVEDVELDNNLISDISAFLYSHSITNLSLSGNLITDVSPIGTLFQTTGGALSVDLSHNLISDFSPLNNVPRMTYLDLSNNQISTIAALDQLPLLETLILCDNTITDITPLDGLGLSNLCLANNLIEEIYVNLPNLRNVNFSGNQIVDLMPIMAHAATLNEVHIQDNLFNPSQLNFLLNYMSLMNSECTILHCDNCGPNECAATIETNNPPALH